MSSDKTKTTGDKAMEIREDYFELSKDEIEQAKKYGLNELLQLSDEEMEQFDTEKFVLLTDPETKSADPHGAGSWKKMSRTVREMSAEEAETKGTCEAFKIVTGNQSIMFEVLRRVYFMLKFMRKHKKNLIDEINDLSHRELTANVKKALIEEMMSDKGSYDYWKGRIDEMKKHYKLP